VTPEGFAEAQKGESIEPELERLYAQIESGSGSYKPQSESSFSKHAIESI